MTSASAGLTLLDRAHGLHLAGDLEGSLRGAATLLTADLEDHGAALLLARLLSNAKRTKTAVALSERLIDGLIRRGALADACVAAQLAKDAGGKTDGFKRIAAAFGKGSPRLGATAGRPPVLPQTSEVAPHFAQLSGDALLEAAEKCAARFLSSRERLAADEKVPALPLFASLEPPRLARLLERMELREHAAGDAVVSQGERGREAFAVVRGLLNVVREGTRGAPELLATLGPGAIFGEMALVTEAPRAASAVAVEPVQLLVVGRSALEELAREDPSIARELGNFCYQRMISNLIRHSAILSSIDAAKRGDLIERFQSESFEPGDVLVRQGEEPSCLYLIASGGVQVRSKDAEGDRVVLAELGPGEVVGEISLVLRRPANADVVALHTTVALALSRERFSDAIREHPTLLRELYDMAVQREEETRSVVAQKALDVSDVVLL